MHDGYPTARVESVKAFHSMYFINMIQWKDVYSLESLLIATTQTYTKCLFQKHKCYTTSHDDKTLFDWARHNKANSIRLHNSLDAKNFKYDSLLKKVIKFPNKTRNVYISTWRDKIVDSMLNTELNRALDHIQSPNSYAYRLKNSGVDICQTNIANLLFSHKKNEPIYIVKRDISNYYPSIDKDILMEILSRYIDKNDYLYSLLKARVYFSSEFGGESLKNEPGVPFGSPLSCFLANMFLIDLDNSIDKLPVHYFRYADDILIFSNNPDDALNANVAMDKCIQKLGLSYKPSHLLNYSFNANHEKFNNVNSFKHLGLLFKSDHKIGIAREKVRKILNIFKRAIKRKEGAISRYKTPISKAKLIIDQINTTINDNIRPVAVIDYYLKHMTDEKQLRDIDRMVAELVLATATDRGYKKSNFKIIPYKKLREMGLISLCHRKRLLQHGHLKSNFFDFRVKKFKARQNSRQS